MFEEMNNEQYKNVYFQDYKFSDLSQCSGSVSGQLSLDKIYERVSLDIISQEDTKRKRYTLNPIQSIQQQDQDENLDKTILSTNQIDEPCEDDIEHDFNKLIDQDQEIKNQKIVENKIQPCVIETIKVDNNIDLQTGNQIIKEQKEILCIDNESKLTLIKDFKQREVIKNQIKFQGNIIHYDKPYKGLDKLKQKIYDYKHMQNKEIKQQNNYSESIENKQSIGQKSLEEQMKEIDMKIFKKILFKKFGKNLPKKQKIETNLKDGIDKQALYISIVVSILCLLIILINVYLFQQ